MKKLGKLNLKKEQMLSHEELVNYRGDLETRVGVIRVQPVLCAGKGYIMIANSTIIQPHHILIGLIVLARVIVDVVS